MKSRVRPRREDGGAGLAIDSRAMMLDIMFELPEHPEGHTYIINERVVRGKRARSLTRPPEPRLLKIQPFGKRLNSRCHQGGGN